MNMTLYNISFFSIWDNNRIIRIRTTKFNRISAHYKKEKIYIHVYEKENKKPASSSLYTVYLQLIYNVFSNM